MSFISRPGGRHKDNPDKRKYSHGKSDTDLFENLVYERRRAKDGFGDPDDYPAFTEGENADTTELNAFEQANSSVSDRRGMSVLSIVIGGCLAAALLCFFLLLNKMNVLPTALFFTAVVAGLFLTILSVAFAADMNKKWRTVLGVVLSALLFGGLLAGSFMLNRAWQTAQKVTTIEPATTVVGVYVHSDDGAQGIEDTADYLFGILKESDREDTDQALQMVANDLNSPISVAEFETVTDLMLALNQKTVSAAVFEAYHIEMLQSLEMEEYNILLDQTRQITSYVVEKKGENVGIESIGASPIQKKEELPEEQKNPHMISVYITGIDTYGTVNVHSRSDVNIMAFINTETHQVLLVTTPRDYYVYTTVSGEYKDKLTHAGLWGPECSMGALEYLYDCELDYYFRLNFSGFINIIDALGGIDFSYTEGGRTSHLSGSAALEIARDRTLCGSDFNRGLNQLKIIKAVINKALSSDLLYHFSDVMDAIEGSFQTTVPYELITETAKQQIADNPSWDIISYGVSGTGASEIPYAFRVYGNATGMYAYVCEPDYTTVEIAHNMIEAMEKDERISAPEA